MRIAGVRGQLIALSGAFFLVACEGEVVPLRLATSTDPAPPMVQVTSLFDDGTTSCAPGDQERDLYVTYGTSLGLFGRVVTRCTDPDGLDRLVAGVEYDLTDNLTIPGCPNPFLNTVDCSTANDWIISHASCSDGMSFSTQIVAGQVQLGGTVNWEGVLTVGDTLDDGREFVDLRTIFQPISATYDGLQPLFLIAMKTRPLGSTADPDVSVGACRRTDVDDWSCEARYNLGVGELAGYEDLGAVRADVDCPPDSVPGDMNCPAPATATIGLAVRTTFDPTMFPDPDITAIADGFFDGGALNWVAVKGDTIPGSSPRVYDRFLDFMAFGRGGGAFGAVDDLGLHYALRWQFQDDAEILVGVEGDPVQGGNAPVRQPVIFSYDGSRAIFENFDPMTGAQQIVYESPMSNALRGIYRNNVDVVGNRTLSDVSLSVRGLSNRVMINGVAHSVSEWPIVALPLERVEVVRDGASAVYGADAVAGVVNLISREKFEIEASFDVGSIDVQSLVRTPGGRLFAGSGDAVDSPLYELDTVTLQPQLVANTSLGGIYGLAATPQSLYGTNRSEFYLVDPDTGATSLVGAFTEQGTGTPVTDIHGMTWVPDSGGIAALSEDGRMWEVNPFNAELDLRHQIPLPEGSQLRSLSATSSSDYTVGADDGRAYQLGVTLAFGSGGAGPVSQEIALVTILDTGDDALSGLTPAPAPAVSLLGCVASLAVALLRKRARQGREPRGR